MTFNKEKAVKKMTLKEFRELGLLQEINRNMLHPRGLALSLAYDDSGDLSFDAILDFRDDPEGCVYADLTSDKAYKKAESVLNMTNAYNHARKKLFEQNGIESNFPNQIQPLGTKINT